MFISRCNEVIYKYLDIIKNIWMILFCGGNCSENIQPNLKSKLSNVLDMKICSVDTLLSLQKELSLAKEAYISKQYVTNGFCENGILNKLNLSILPLTKQLKSNLGYDLDFDNQFIGCKKYDLKKDIK